MNEEQENMMTQMMEQFLSNMTAEEKKKMMKQMMPKLMEKMMEGLTEEDKRELMMQMMPTMMSQMFGEGGMPSMMQEMMSKKTNEEGKSCADMPCGGTQKDFKPWKFCPCRELCEKGFKEEPSES